MWSLTVILPRFVLITLLLNRVQTKTRLAVLAKKRKSVRRQRSNTKRQTKIRSQHEQAYENLNTSRQSLRKCGPITTTVFNFVARGVKSLLLVCPVAPFEALVLSTFMSILTYHITTYV